VAPRNKKWSGRKRNGRKISSCIMATCGTFGLIHLIFGYTKYTLNTSFPLIVVDITLI
jgi:vacuolar-type H+-ATPase subunit I/STV1